MQILDETLIPLTEARNHLPRRPDKATVWRWYSKGLGGVRLETAVIGGRRFTSREAIARFIQRRTETVNSAIGGEDAQARAERQASHDESVERELDSRGIGTPRRRRQRLAMPSQN